MGPALSPAGRAGFAVSLLTPCYRLTATLKTGNVHRLPDGGYDTTR